MAGPSAAGPAAGPTPILIVDDSAVVRAKLGKLLTSNGYAVTVARHGNEALEAIAQQWFAVMITDLEMPEMDGYILTKNIKSDSRFAGIPVIMHSSLSSTSNQQIGRSVGVDDYVPKFEAQRLAETLGRLLLKEEPPAKAA